METVHIIFFYYVKLKIINIFHHKTIFICNRKAVDLRALKVYKKEYSKMQKQSIKIKNISALQIQDYQNG